MNFHTDFPSWILLCAILLCSPRLSLSQKSATLSPRDLTGTWQSTHIHVDVHSKNGTQQSETVSASLEEYPKVLGIKSNFGEYRSDGTYVEYYLNEKDSIIHQTHGKWMVKEDSMILNQLKPSAQEARYRVEKKGDEAIFYGFVDWDGDGKADDAFEGTAKKINDEMTTYYMVFLYRGENAKKMSKEEAEKVQAAHMANIRKLAEEGKMVLAGPFTDGGEMRGIFILKAQSLEEAQEFTLTDPAVIAGRLRMEVKPWYGPMRLQEIMEN